MPVLLPWRDITILITLSHDVITTWAKRQLPPQLPRASSRIWKKAATNALLLEKLQYRALRLVFNDFDSSYETLLESVNMPTLHISRIKLFAVDTFKILDKMSPVYLQDL